MKPDLIEKVLCNVYDAELMIVPNGVSAYNQYFVFTVSENLRLQVTFRDEVILDKTFKTSLSCARFLVLNDAFLYKEALRRYLNLV